MDVTADSWHQTRVGRPVPPACPAAAWEGRASTWAQGREGKDIEAPGASTCPTRVSACSPGGAGRRWSPRLPCGLWVLLSHRCLFGAGGGRVSGPCEKTWAVLVGCGPGCRVTHSPQHTHQGADVALRMSLFL